MLRTLWNLSPFRDSRGVGIPKMLQSSRISRSTQQGESSSTCLRCYSSDKKDEVPASGQVFKHDRHNMYVCWHPEVPFPYEMTKPIDTSAPVTDSNLKVQALVPVREAFREKSKRMMIQELIKLTYSTKHRFYGKYGKSKRKHLMDLDPNKTRRNREYL